MQRVIAVEGWKIVQRVIASRGVEDSVAMKKDCYGVL